MSEKPISRNFTDAFTGIRGIACLCVILSHTMDFHIHANASLIHAGWSAVMLFFVLSAYLLTRNMLKEIVPKKDGSPRSVLNMTLVNYFIKRFFRIYPPFVVVVLIQYGIYLYYGPQPRYGEFDFGLAWTHLSLGIVRNHLWTIRPEVIFYFLVLPPYAILASILMKIDYKYFKGYRFKTFYLLVLALTIATYYTVHRHLKAYHSYGALHFFKEDFYSYFPFFGYGMLAGTLSHYLQSYEVKLNTKVKKAVCEFILYSIFLFMYFGNDTIAQKYLHPDQGKQFWYQYYSTTGLVFTISCLILEKTGTQSSIGGFLSSPLIVWMGKCSYSVYLIHMLVVLWIIHQFPGLSEIDGTLQIVFACFFAGFILYSAVEEPGFKLAKPVVKAIEKRAKYVSELIQKNYNLSRSDEENIKFRDEVQITSDNGSRYLQKKNESL